MEMEALAETFRNKRIDRDIYLKLMHDKQIALKECSAMIQQSGITKIEITSDGVIVTSKKGIRLYVDFDELPAGIALRLLNLGGYEEEEFSFSTQLIEENDVVFDIGANIGFFSLSIMQAKENIQVHAFEPVAKTFANMKRNLGINVNGGVINYNFGFYYEKTEIEFFVPKLCGAASIKKIIEDDNSEKVTCKLVKIDDFFPESKLDRLDFIKCDVEGAEKYVFQGGKETIEKYKPIIFSEMLRKHAEKFNYHPNEIIEMMKAMGYRCFTLNDNKLKEFFIMDEKTVQTNFFFLHAEKHQEKIEKYRIKKTP